MLRIWKDKDYKPCTKRDCFKCRKTGHSIKNCTYDDGDDDDKEEDKKGEKKVENKKFFKKKGGEAHISKEWDSDDNSPKSNDEGVATLTFHKSSLFPKVYHKSLMAKKSKKKVYTRNSTKYTSSSDDDDFSDEENMIFFKGLCRYQITEVNKLIKTINEKDELLVKKDDLLVDKTKKNDKLEKVLAHEKENIKILTHELKPCNDLICSIQCATDGLIAKIVKLDNCHASSSSIEHVSICTRCKDVDVDVYIINVAMIASLKGHIAKIENQTKTGKVEIENENIKYVRVVYLNGRHLGIKDGVGFQMGPPRSR
jgi:hypothetical protein